MKCQIVEILYTSHCPHLRGAIQRVHDAMDARRDATAVEIRLVLVETAGEAFALRFLGSPTVRVDGQDVEPNVSSTMFGLHGRGYFVEGRVERLPPSDWILRAF